MKQAVLVLSILVAFLCGQTFAAATAMPVSNRISFVKIPAKDLSKSLLPHKFTPSGKDTQQPVFPKKKRSKCLQHDFLICQFSEMHFAILELVADAPSYLQNNCLSVIFLPNGKRGPPLV